MRFGESFGKTAHNGRVYMKQHISRKKNQCLAILVDAGGMKQ